MSELPELSVVMPCLNEADTVGICVEKAVRAMQEHGVHGEVVLADNGSTDNSKEIAVSKGARTVDVVEPGYGAALMGGIEASQGKYVIMGDCDDSYDFLEIPAFVDQLRKGSDLYKAAACHVEEAKYFPAQCHFYTAGLGIPFYHGWFG